MAQSKSKKQPSPAKNSSTQTSESLKKKALKVVSANDDAPKSATSVEAVETPAPALSGEDAIKALKKIGRERGFVTHDELNNALPQGDLTSEQIEDVMAELNRMGVNVVDVADQDEDAASETNERASGNISDENRGSDDPVRMYLREMGVVELLSREGEIAIAKRMEAGRELMLGGFTNRPSPCAPCNNGAMKLTKGRSCSAM